MEGFGWMSHVFCVFIDWLSSHLSLTLILNWGLTPPCGSRAGQARGPRWFLNPGRVQMRRLRVGWQTLGCGSSAQICQVKRGKPPLISPPTTSTMLLCVSWVRLLTISVCTYVCVCVHKYYWPNSALCRRDHLLWPSSVLVCVGIKGGMMGIKRKVKV